MKNFQPLRDNLLIKLVKDEVKNGRILRVDMDQDRLKEGVVIAAGDGRYSFNGTLVPMKSKVGDVVLFNKLSSYTIEDKETAEQYLIISEEFVTGIL